MSETFFSFLLFTVIATTTPGGATALATASGVQFGFRRSISLIMGIAAGMAILAAGAALGLAAVLQTLPVLALLMKALGSAYLLWLAWIIGRAGAPGVGTGKDDGPIGFAAGMFLLILNPKGWAMTLGAAASFSSMASSPAALAMIMGTVFALAATASLTLWCLGGALLNWVLRGEAQWRLVNIVLAALLAASILPIWM